MICAVGAVGAVGDISLHITGMWWFGRPAVNEAFSRRRRKGPRGRASGSPSLQRIALHHLRTNHNATKSPALSTSGKMHRLPIAGTTCATCWSESSSSHEHPSADLRSVKSWVLGRHEQSEPLETKLFQERLLPKSQPRRLHSAGLYSSSPSVPFSHLLGHNIPKHYIVCLFTTLNSFIHNVYATLRGGRHPSRRIRRPGLACPPADDTRPEPKGAPSSAPSRSAPPPASSRAPMATRPRASRRRLAPPSSWTGSPSPPARPST